MQSYPIIEGFRQEPKQGDTTRYLLTSGPLHVPPIPHYPEFTDHAAAFSAAAHALAKLESTRAAVAGDQTLSDYGKTSRLELPARDAAAAVEKAKRTLATFKAQAETKEKAVYAPPVLEKGDYAGAVLDAEIRQWVRSVPESRGAEVRAAMTADPRVIAAIMRSPVPVGMLQDTAAKMWRDNLGPDHPGVAELTRQREAIAWAEKLVNWVHFHVDDQAFTLTELDQMGIIGHAHRPRFEPNPEATFNLTEADRAAANAQAEPIPAEAA